MNKWIIMITRMLSGLLIVLLFNGCKGPVKSAADEIATFNRAGPIIPGLEVNEPGKPEMGINLYRVVCGDVLELHMPFVLQSLRHDSSIPFDKVQPLLCRVGDSGNIILPIVGQINVAGKQLAEIEQIVAGAYYPKYVVNAPTVMCRISEYRNENAQVLTVIGLVKKPDIYDYPPDVRYNLTEALAFAGGINMVADPHFVQIFRQGQAGEVIRATFRIDNKSLDEAYNVILKPGDVVYVAQTPRTKMNAFLSDVLNLRMGVEVRNNP